MHVRVLGDLEVDRDGQPVVLGGPKPRALLGLLVASGGRPVATGRLVNQLWGDDPPAKALGALQAYVSKLRRRLEDGRGHPGVLVTRPSGYALVLPDGAVDAPEFERAVGEADADERLLVRALDLWRGPAYADLRSTPALAAEGRRLDDLRVGALERLWAVRLAGGATDSAVAPLQALAAEHPTRERPAALLVRALYRSGRQADALDALRRVRRSLADELGIDPGPELQQLEQAVLRQDADLLQPARPAVAAPRHTPRPVGVPPL
jgi:DNA-binding SARP family transcriptional activator